MASSISENSSRSLVKKTNMAVKIFFPPPLKFMFAIITRVIVRSRVLKLLYDLMKDTHEVLRAEGNEIWQQLWN